MHLRGVHVVMIKGAMFKKDNATCIHSITQREKKSRRVLLSTRFHSDESTIKTAAQQIKKNAPRLQVFGLWASNRLPISHTWRRPSGKNNCEGITQQKPHITHNLSI